MRPIFAPKFVTKVKPNIKLVKVHPQLSNNKHPVDGALVVAGSLRPRRCTVNFWCGYWGLVESQWIESHKFSSTQSFPIFLLIHPFIHPSMPHAIYARLLWVHLGSFERNGFDLPVAITGTVQIPTRRRGGWQRRTPKCK
jgi:hypothetical protein